MQQNVLHYLCNFIANATQLRRIFFLYFIPLCNFLKRFLVPEIVLSQSLCELN
jgi:hypothetical protein